MAVPFSLVGGTEMVWFSYSGGGDGGVTWHRKISINTSTFPSLSGGNHWGETVGTRATGLPCPRSCLLRAHVRILCVMSPDSVEAGATGGSGPLSHARRHHHASLAPREALQGQLLPAEEDQDAEGVCKPLSCGWEITDSLCVGPVFTPASIM